jgi:hypothetical protein
MTPRMNLVAGPGKISFRLLAEEEINDMGLEDLKPPFCYGLVTSLGWNFTHTKNGDVIIFDTNTAIKVNKDTYVMEERMILAKFVEDATAEGDFFKGFRE